VARKDRERLARRKEIVRAARAVFAEKGFEHATLEEIAERAEFGKGTVYNYFDSKETLFTAAMMDLFDDVTGIARAVCDLKIPAREALAEYMRRTVAYFQTNFDFCRMLMREWVRPELEGLTCPMDELHARVQAVAEPLAQFMKAAMRRKEIRRADPMVLAKMFIGLVHDYYIMNLAPPRPAGDIETQVELVVSVFFDGIAVPAGRSRT
jgi:AcrR family transcriptional regulator